MKQQAKELRFKRKYFLMVRSGQKDLECRINYPFIRHFKKGDIVRFFWEHLEMTVKIVAVRHYQSFKEMLEQEDVNRLVPGMTKDEALAEYQAIYPDWKVKKNGGLVVFGVEEAK